GQASGRIRALYLRRPSPGEEPRSGIARRPRDRLDAVEGRPAAPPSEDAPKVAVEKSPTSTPLPPTRKPLPIANPFRACISAVRIIGNRRPLFFGLGAVFVASLSVASMLQYNAAVASNFAYQPNPLLQLLFLASSHTSSGAGFGSRDRAAASASSGG